MLLRLAFSIGCFQETRNASGRSRTFAIVLMMASAACNGDHGCEIWINLSIPFCRRGDKKIFLTRDDVTVVFSDPSLLIVRCCADNVDFYVISAHAPYCKSDTVAGDACLKWWSDFSINVSTTCIKGIPIFVGIDGNHSVFSDASTGIGEATHGHPSTRVLAT